MLVGVVYAGGLCILNLISDPGIARFVRSIFIQRPCSHYCC